MHPDLTEFLRTLSPIPMAAPALRTAWDIICHGRGAHGPFTDGKPLERARRRQSDQSSGDVFWGRDTACKFGIVMRPVQTRSLVQMLQDAIDQPRLVGH